MALQEIAIREFWKEFLRTETALFAGERPEPVLGKLIERVHPDLEFDIGRAASGKKEIVISAGGIREAFPAVEALAQGAPPLPRWNVVRYRQRRLPAGSFTFGGLSLDPHTITFTMSSGGPAAGIVLYMPGYTRGEHSRYLALALHVLDAVLGEYDVEMKLGSIRIEPPGAGPGDRAVTIDRLAAVFDASLHESRN